MSTHQFLVTVDVDNWPDFVPVYEDGVIRTPADLAADALGRAGVLGVSNWDGWADFPAGVGVSIESVEEWD